MERKFSFTEEEFYHVYNRGTDKRVIFFDKTDYIYFQKLLFICNSKNRIILRDLPKGQDVYSVERDGTLVDIGSYCLMPNHFHLLLYEKQEDAISLFMQKIATAYAMYFNKRHKRSGALFEGCFKAIHVDTDEYLQYLFAYIHLNPIKILQPDWKERGIKNLEESRSFLNSYRYSSHVEYLDHNRKEASIIEKSNFPEYFSSPHDFEFFMDEWLTFGNQFETDGSTPTQVSPV